MKKILILLLTASLVIFAAAACSTAQGMEGSFETTPEASVAPSEEPVPSSAPAEEPVVEGEEPLTDSGRYVGLIDQNSIEVLISGVPEEEAARAFRLTDEAKEMIENLRLETLEEVIFEYEISDIGQYWILKIERLVN